METITPYLAIAHTPTYVEVNSTARMFPSYHNTQHCLQVYSMISNAAPNGLKHNTYDIASRFQFSEKCAFHETTAHPHTQTPHTKSSSLP